MNQLVIPPRPPAPVIDIGDKPIQPLAYTARRRLRHVIGF